MPIYINFDYRSSTYLLFIFLFDFNFSFSFLSIDYFCLDTICQTTTFINNISDHLLDICHLLQLNDDSTECCRRIISPFIVISRTFILFNLLLCSTSLQFPLQQFQSKYHRDWWQFKVFKRANFKCSLHSNVFLSNFDSLIACDETVAK